MLVGCPLPDVVVCDAIRALSLFSTYNIQREVWNKADCCFRIPPQADCSPYLGIIMASVIGATPPLQTLSRTTCRPSLSYSGTSCLPFTSSFLSGEKGAFPGLPLSKASTKRTICQYLNRTVQSSTVLEEGINGLGFEGTDDLSYFGSDYDKEDADTLEICKLNLPQQLVEALAKRGITTLFPVQRAVLTPALEGRDLIARAKTGTGKTLAFGIPIIRRLTEDREGSTVLSRRSGKLPRALVLAPTRELAKQVEKEFRESAPFLSTVCIYGGVSYTVQERTLARGVDVVVGTPGRIIDLIKNNVLRLNEVQFLVLDEADQMLAVGFEEDVEVILEKLPTERQSMLFSATMPAWVKKLARKYLDDPMTIDLVGDHDEKLAEGIKLYAIGATVASKRPILSDLITVYAKGGKTIVFTQTKQDADDVSLALSKTIACEALHGDISQHQRERTLNAFREGKYLVLVATDVAARGLDIPNVDLVIHYELPNDPETFVHRSGRTGRAGKEGIAILMYTDRQRRTVKSLERDVGCRFEFTSPPQIQDVLESSTQQVIKLLGGVHPELKDVFLPTANQLLEKEGTDAFAAALAHLSGYTQLPASRSLITHEEGWITLQITRHSVQGGGRPLISIRAVMATLSQMMPEAADRVGKIYLINDEKEEGAVFDLPEDVAKELLSKESLFGYTIQKISKLPEIEEDEAPRSGYGKFSFKGTNNRSSRGWRESNDARKSSSWGRSSYGQDNNWGYKGWRDGGNVRKSSSWGGRRYGQDNNGDSKGWEDNDVGKTSSWRKSSYSQDNNWLGVGQQRNRAFSTEDRNMTFRGSCFICGQSGHRAANCPSK